MDLIKKILSNTKIKYLISGTIAFSIEYVVFLLLIRIISNVFLVNSLSFIVGLLISFTFNRLWSFGSVSPTDKHKYSLKTQIISYISLAMVNMVFSNIIIGVLISVGVLPSVAKILTMLVIVFWNYIIYSRAIFRKAQT